MICKYGLVKLRIKNQDLKRMSEKFVKSMPQCPAPPLGTLRSTSYCNLVLIVLSRYTYPFILVSPYCFILYPAGTTRITPSS